MKLALEKKIEYLDNINAGMAKSKACKIVGISRPTGDKWLQDFKDHGPPNLNIENYVAENGSRKTRHKHHNEIVEMALRFPQKGSEWISKKLIGQGIKASTGGVYYSLKSVNLETKPGRRERLLIEYNQDPQNFSEEAIAGLESVSPHFRYRSYTRQKPGELVFVFTENGYVSNSRKKVRFTILLDCCGFMVFIDPNSNCYLPERDRMLGLPTISNHPYLQPLESAIQKFYDYFDFQINMICVEIWDKKGMHAHRLKNLLKDKNISVGALQVKDFNDIQFIADFRKRFAEEFVKKDLKTIQHRRRNEETRINIVNITSSFIKKYNLSSIPSWPNLDKSPYQYVSDLTNKKIWLPSMEEWLPSLKRFHDEIRKINLEKSK